MEVEVAELKGEEGQRRKGGKANFWKKRIETERRTGR